MIIAYWNTGNHINLKPGNLCVLLPAGENILAVMKNTARHRANMILRLHVI